MIGRRTFFRRMFGLTAGAAVVAALPETVAARSCLTINTMPAFVNEMARAHMAAMQEHVENHRILTAMRPLCGTAQITVRHGD